MASGGVPGPDRALYGAVREETEGPPSPVDPHEPLRDGAGRLFEPSCVDALDRVLGRERGTQLAVAV